MRLQASALWLRCAAYCRCAMSTFCSGVNTARAETLSPAFLHCGTFQDRIALICRGKRYSYQQLLSASTQLADLIAKSLPAKVRRGCLPSHEVNSKHSSDVRKEYNKQPRVAILCENNVSYVTALFGVWSLGCIAVPLCKSHPKDEVQYVLRDSGTSVLVSVREFADTAKELASDCGIAHVSASSAGSGCLDASSGKQLGRVGEEVWSTVNWGELGALIVYTSGTTGRPKGVLSTHKNVRCVGIHAARSVLDHVWLKISLPLCFPLIPYRSHQFEPFVLLPTPHVVYRCPCYSKPGGGVVMMSPSTPFPFTTSTAS